jgi:hypothetical protein
LRRHAQGMRAQRSARPMPWPRNRSVRAARVRATLHMLHTQGLSRSPQTVPTNTETADQTCWSAACAYARRRRKRPYLAAGEHVNFRAPSYERNSQERWAILYRHPDGPGVPQHSVTPCLLKATSRCETTGQLVHTRRATLVLLRVRLPHGWSAQSLPLVFPGDRGVQGILTFSCRHAVSPTVRPWTQGHADGAPARPPPGTMRRLR